MLVLLRDLNFLSICIFFKCIKTHTHSASACVSVCHFRSNAYQPSSFVIVVAPLVRFLLQLYMQRRQKLANASPSTSPPQSRPQMSMAFCWKLVDAAGSGRGQPPFATTWLHCDKRQPRNSYTTELRVC